MRTINNEIMMQYDLSIHKMIYSRSNYYLETNKGQFLLRKVLIPKEQVMFEYEVNRQLIDKGFQEIEKIYATQRNQPYVLYQDKLYILQSNNHTADTDFTELSDIKAIIGVLARFHQAARDIEGTGREGIEANFKNIYDYFSKRTSETKQIKKSISRIAQKSPFESRFLQDYRVYEDLQNRALNLISHDLCEAVVIDARSNRCIAHNDYTYHAVARAMNHNYFINNLDQCGYSVQLMDLSGVLIKIMQKNNWNIGLLNQLIDEYVKYHALSLNEIQILKAMLIFPEKYAMICHKYVMSRRRNHYSMFELKWDNMQVYKEEQLKAAINIEKYL